jgi:hypothetical protein
MATCELPLGALLLADEVLAVHCTLNRTAGARPIAVRGAAELLLELSTLHVGAEQPDDQVPGVPAVWLHGLAQQRRAEIGAATRLQAGYRGRKLRRYIISRRQSPELVRQKLEAPRSLSAEAAEASHAESAGGTVCLALRRCPHGSWRLVRRLVRTVAPCCEACCRPALSGLRGRAYEVYHNRAPASAPGRASDGAAAGALVTALLRREEARQAPLITRTRLECSGTVRTVELALEHGLAANLAGGTHHAHRSFGSGFTILNDLAVATAWARNNAGIGRVLIVDLDVHQGTLARLVSLTRAGCSL